MKLKEMKMDVSLSEEDLNDLLEVLEWGMSDFNDEFPEQKKDLARKQALYERLTRTKKRLVTRKG